MEAYTKQLLQSILQDDISDEIVQYMLSLTTVEDFDEFLENIIDRGNADHMEVYGALKEQFNLTRETPRKREKNRETYQKVDKIDNSSQKAGSKSSNQRSKKKYVNFYGQDHKPGLLKGRHPCQCEATKHELINNCRNCGRIVCAQEGSGPCFFCDEMVCTRYEMEILQGSSKASTQLYNQLLEQKKSKEWKKAIESRNKLLNTDRMGDSIKNKILDDENDYFDVNGRWLNSEEKSSRSAKYLTAYNRVHKSRKDLKLALDFASRTVSIETDETMKNKDKLMRGVNKLLDSTERRFPKNLFEGDKGDLVAELVKLMDESSLNTEQNLPRKQTAGITNLNRISNSEFLDTVDQGMCLSMHQPWASLLVAGIKIHEGRTWRTQHRGRLWIAAASKEPEDDEILACEEMYRDYYSDPTLEFPKKYPTSCLLGCVTVDDCLEQGEYRKRFPHGESSSPYVLICSNPVILPIFYPMQGQHKIFSLTKDLHNVAKAALLSSKWL